MSTPTINVEGKTINSGFGSGIGNLQKANDKYESRKNELPRSSGTAGLYNGQTVTKSLNNGFLSG